MPTVTIGSSASSFSEKLIKTRPPARDLDGRKANIRSYKNTIYELELDLKEMKWFNFFRKKDLKYKIREYQKLLACEEYAIKLRKEDGLE